jgi:hypothetical protein
MSQRREVSSFLHRLDFAPNNITDFIYQPKLRPGKEENMQRNYGNGCSSGSWADQKIDRATSMEK